MGEETRHTRVESLMFHGPAMARGEIAQDASRAVPTGRADLQFPSRDVDRAALTPNKAPPNLDFRKSMVGQQLDLPRRLARPTPRRVHGAPRPPQRHRKGHRGLTGRSPSPPNA